MTPRTVEQPTKVTPLRDGPSFHAAVLTTPRAYLTRRQNYAAFFVLCVCVQCAGLPSIPRTHLAHRENCALSVYSRGVLYVLCRYLYIKKATRRHFELRESHAFVYAVCVGPSKN